MHGTLWKTVTLRLRQARLPMEAWERQLNLALSNLHSLVCRSTGQTPHTLFLGSSRRSPFLDLPIASHPGKLPNPSNDPEPSVPGWMQEGAEALLGCAVCTKEEPLVDPVVIQEVISPYIRCSGTPPVWPRRDCIFSPNSSLSESYRRNTCGSSSSLDC